MVVTWLTGTWYTSCATSTTIRKAFWQWLGCRRSTWVGCGIAFQTRRDRSADRRSSTSRTRAATNIASSETTAFTRSGEWWTCRDLWPQPHSTDLDSVSRLGEKSPIGLLFEIVGDQTLALVTTGSHFGSLCEWHAACLRHSGERNVG